MAASIETGLEFKNTSLEGHKAMGGKLNVDQTRERAKLHAERFAYGKPTIQMIADHWLNKYGISIHYTTEKEWASRNEALIIETMNRMVEDGELKLQITEQSLLNSVNISGSETARTLRLMETKLARLLACLDPDFDPMAKLGLTEDDYKALDKDKKREVDLELAKLEARNKMVQTFLPKLSNMIVEHKKVLLETVLATKGIFDDSKLKEIHIQKEVKKEVGKRLDSDLNKAGFDPIETEVSDEDRKALIEPGRAS